ncbi:MAG TPA: glycosyltransferase [Ignavibacteria bacterium]|nr:glycosyltransferase [Ignavibacteria bacterium]HMR39969.1 glycosyltransferase [Ignavibacteria bacterium]
MKILFISYDFPFPPSGGSISRDYNLIKQLSKHHELHWINRTIRGKIKKEYKDEMKKYFKEMNIVEWDYSQNPAGLLKSMITKTPYIIKRFESDQMKDLVSKKISENKFDLIFCDHIYLSQYISDTIPGNIPVIPNNEDCGFTYYKRMTENSGFTRSVYARSQWKKLLEYEIEVLKKYKVYITTSEKEKELISEYYNEAEIGVIENGVDTGFFSPKLRDDPVPNIVFTAWFKYYPNVKAAIDFTNNVFPEIRKKIPGIKFYIVGKEPPPVVKKLENTEGVTVTGYVNDIRDYLKNADAAVIPLQIGGGTRLKILEAMSMKIPVVSTPLGAEGLEVEDGTNILIAQNDEDFVNKVVNVINDKQLSGKLSENGRELMLEKYDWEISGNKLNQFLNSYVKNFNSK